MGESMAAVTAKRLPCEIHANPRSGVRSRDTSAQHRGRPRYRGRGGHRRPAAYVGVPAAWPARAYRTRGGPPETDRPVLESRAHGRRGLGAPALDDAKLVRVVVSHAGKIEARSANYTASASAQCATVRGRFGACACNSITTAFCAHFSPSLLRLGDSQRIVTDEGRARRRMRPERTCRPRKPHSRAKQNGPASSAGPFAFGRRVTRSWLPRAGASSSCRS